MKRQIPSNECESAPPQTLGTECRHTATNHFPNAHIKSSNTIAYLSPAWRSQGISNGIASYVKNLVPSLIALGSDPIVLTSNVDADNVPSFVRLIRRLEPSDLGFWQRALRRVSLHWWLTRNASNDIIRELEVLHQDSAVDLIEMEESFGFAYDIVRRGPVPVVVRLHGPHFLIGPLNGHHRGRIFSNRVKREGLGISAAAGVSVPSKDVLEKTRAHYRLPLPDARVIPNPVLPCALKDLWNPSECDPDLVLFVGRFDGVKGGDTMIDAFAIVARKHPTARLAFAGPDNGIVDKHQKKWKLQEYLRDCLPGNAENSRVTYLGPQTHDQISQLRRKAAVTVVCSRYENFPLAALEAMAAGCPLIASNVGGLAEIIQHQHNGLHCRPDDPDDLAEKILALLNNPQLAAGLGAQALEDATSRYRPDIIARQTLEFYAEVLARRNHGKRKSD